MKYIKSTSKNLPAKAGIDDLLLGFEVFTFLKGFLGLSVDLFQQNFGRIYSKIYDGGS